MIIRCQMDEKQLLALFATPSMDDHYLWTQHKTGKFLG